MSKIDAKAISQDYSKYLDVNLTEKLKPLQQSVDDMLIRLDEFQTMLTMLQQEQCGALGVTGSLTHTVENFGEFKKLCARIDALEKLIEHVKNNLDSVERKMDAAEEHYGLVDNASKIKNLFSPLFKKTVGTKVGGSCNEMELFATEDYFHSS